MEERINMMLLDLMGWDAIDEWWRTPNDAFNGLSPGDVDDLMEVYDHVEFIHKAADKYV